jgi:GTP-binding protein EngB required for normal cell division
MEDKAIELSFYRDKDNYSLGDYVTLTLTITTKKTMNLNDSYFYFKGDNYFQPTKEYVKKQYNTKIILKPWAQPSFDKLSSTILIELFDKNNRLLSSIRAFFPLNYFTGNFFNENKEKQTRNILLFGLAGSTKSSFINSCYTLINNKVMKEIAKSGGHTQRVTTELKSYRLIDFEKKKTSNYRLWDTWGIERNNYQNCEFEQIINGYYQSGHKMNTRVSVADFDNKESDENNNQHCVIFFIPASELDNSNGPMLQKTREYVEIATEQGISSVIALSKLDQISPSFRENSEKENTDVKNYIAKASKIFNLQPNRIFPVLNYLHEKEKSFAIDKIISNLLYTAAEIADSYYMKNLDQDIINLINS